MSAWDVLDSTSETPVLLHLIMLRHLSKLESAAFPISTRFSSQISDPGLFARYFFGEIVAKAIESCSFGEERSNNEIHSFHGMLHGCNASSMRILLLKHGNSIPMLEFHVEKLNQGRTFSSKRVDVTLDKQIISSALISFQSIDNVTDDSKMRFSSKDTKVNKLHIDPTLPDYSQIELNPNSFVEKILNKNGLILKPALPAQEAKDNSKDRYYWFRFDSSLSQLYQQHQGIAYILVSLFYVLF